MATSMAHAHAQDKASRVERMQSLPPVCGSITSTTLCNERGVTSASTHTPPAASSSGESTSTCDSLPKPPQGERFNSQLSFRRARIRTSPPLTQVSVQSGGISVRYVNDSIVKEVPNAVIVHVHDGTAPETSTIISIGSSFDFGKAFNNSSPSFIFVDNSEKSANLAIDMLGNQAGQLDGAVIIVLVQQEVTDDLTFLVNKVPDFVKSGADDILMIPAGATSMRSSILASLAKATASRDQKLKFGNQAQIWEKQCYRLFWKDVHDSFPAFPRIQPRLHEIHAKTVGDLALVHKLGEGSFGSVYTWEHETRNTSGAVKVFTKSKVSSVSAARKIATECAVLQRLRHKNVVMFLGSAHGMQCVYLFMELAGARTLFQVMRTEAAQGLPWSCAVEVFSDITAGVAHCHKMQVAHCDLKPENIVVSESGYAKIVDFGEAVDFAEDVAPLQGVLGTMPFTAPEIMCVCPDWDPPAADVWSLGVILVEMLCGNNAFVRLLGWHTLRKKSLSPSMLSQRADELKVFFAKDGTNTNEHAMIAISGLCFDVPPPPMMELLGNMLLFMPLERVSAESAAECIENLSTEVP